MAVTILDCYTDEPAGLGVPPYLGVYPRYIAGKLLLDNEEINYITIDDLRFFINIKKTIGKISMKKIKINEKEPINKNN